MSLKVKVSLGERTLNRLFYGKPPPRKAGGLARDKWAFDIINEAFDEVRKESEVATAALKEECEKYLANIEQRQREFTAVVDELARKSKDLRAWEIDAKRYQSERDTAVKERDLLMLAPNNRLDAYREQGEMCAALHNAKDAAVAALASARAEVEMAQANLDALISYPCAVAFDAAREGWTVTDSAGVSFALDEGKQSIVDRARALAMEELVRYLPSLGVLIGETDRTELLALAPLPASLVAIPVDVKAQVIEALRLAGVWLEIERQAYVEDAGEVEEEHLLALETVRAALAALGEAK